MKKYKVIEAAAYRTALGTVIGFETRPGFIMAANEDSALGKAADKKSIIEDRKDIISWNWYVVEI